MIFKNILNWLTKFIESGKPRPADSGIFDPYVPLGSLKPVRDDFSKEPASPEEIDKNNSFDEVTAFRRSFTLFKVLVILISSVLLFRLVFLQITQGQENFLLAEGNRLKTEPILSPRGLLYDRNGIALVQNIPSFSLILHPAELSRNSSELTKSVATISKLVSMDNNELNRIIEDGRSKESLVIREGLSREEALSYELRLEGISGIDLATVPVRNYLDIPSLGHLLGYIGKINTEEIDQRRELLPISYIGKTGVEKIYDRILQGIPGVETLEVDSMGRTIRSIGIKPAKVGRSLLLAVDSTLQAVAANSLLESIQKNNATSGAAVVMDVRNGDILAMVSVPFVNNNIFSPGGDVKLRQEALINPGAPLLNRAIAGQYPSGSTIKPLVAAAALQEGVISENVKIDTSAGEIVIGQWRFPDWKVHGLADVKQAIAESNNIFFYTIGGGNGNISGLGANRLSEYFKKFGFGDYTGIDLSGEMKGLVPDPDWKLSYKDERWYIGDTYNLAIGQGDLLVTPLQLTRATAAVANSGKLLTPRVVKKYLSTDKQGVEELPVNIVKDNFINPYILDIVRQGMRMTVTTGSARSFSILPVQIAAKTGTAQFDIAKKRTHSWFTAFAPYENPEIAISVIIEGGGEGFSVAAPVAKNIIEKYFSLPLTPIVTAITE